MKELLAQHFPVAPFVQVAPADEWERAVRLAVMVSEPGGPVDRQRLHDIVRSVIS